MGRYWPILSLVGVFLFLLLLGLFSGNNDHRRDEIQNEHLKATKLIAESLQDLDRRVRKLEKK